MASRISASSALGERPHGSGGQALALMALVLVGLLGMVALVVDGGNAFAQQRASQNGTDAAAEAGAVALANRLVGVAVTDLMVSTAVQDAGADNAVTISSAEYTDVNGDSLNATVGGGTIPTGAYGVRAFGTRTFDTFIGGVIGITSLTASTKATAVSGFEKSDCSLTEGCVLLPITPPINSTTCATQPARPVTGADEWPKDPIVSVIPLCSSGAGNVGWIDWNFAYGGSPNGGTSSTVTSTITPDNPTIHFPTWLQISQAGNTSASTLEAAINRYNGQVVMLPVFSHTCGSNPVPDTSWTLVEDQYQDIGDDTSKAFGCKANLDDGNGTKMWYYLAGYRSLLLCGIDVEDCRDAIPAWTQGAYLSGSSNPGLYCATSGGTGCIVGKWTTVAATVGTIDKDFPGGGGASSNSGITVVLIR